MFADEVSEVFGAESLWRKSKAAQSESKSCQTAKLSTAEAAVQAVHRRDISIQVEPDRQDTEQLASLHGSSDCHPGLVEFLQRVEKSVIAELNKSSRSHAFDGFDVNWCDRTQTVSCLHTLQYPEALERHLHVTGLSWNATGSVIACSYGRMDDGDWSTEKSFLCTWNLDRRGLNTKHPDIVLDVSSSVMCLAFHPSQPSLFAGGTYSGEVLVWDTSQTDDPLISRTGFSDESHTEPVCQVGWIKNSVRSNQFHILSASSDGKILIWQLDGNDRLKLHNGFALVAHQIPRNIKLNKARGDTAFGITALSFSRFDPNVFIVGVEGGYLLKCSTTVGTLATVSSTVSAVPLKAPAEFTFCPHCGPAYTVHCSPFHRNLFLSAGTDGFVHLYSMLQAQPLISFHVSAKYIFSVRWSPTRPLVFAVATGEGTVLIFDLRHGAFTPPISIEQSSDNKEFYCMEFNPRQTHLLAAGSADGSVKIWQLNDELTEQGSQELNHLKQLANKVTY
ncbi:cytoplasmic dynein 2 intermediate chain 2 [Protopterus annectens]|uniref:cytoplasmic dynein 2 intermediate chain 2 n=1 Tax=Protopterus annectens TaxID=7888 RepID=UPI001CFB41D5|nr:cytoplasmic dynein 2 intermediate chain 2 [Protopterus annectens]